MSIGDRLKAVRKSLGLTQLKFAKGISISVGYLQALEYSNKTVNDRILRLISSEYKINEQWLRSGEGPMLYKDTEVEITNLISAYKSLDRHFQVFALEHINRLVDLQRTR